MSKRQPTRPSCNIRSYFGVTGPAEKQRRVEEDAEQDTERAAVAIKNCD